MNKVLLLRFLRLAEARLRRFRRSLLPAEIVVFEDVTAPWLASALGVVSRLDLAARVPTSGWLELKSLAEDVEIPLNQLERLFRLLTAHGYFKLTEDGGRVRHNRLSRGLQLGRAGFFCLLQSSSWYRRCFASDPVVQAMRSSRPPFAEVSGLPFFEFAQEHPESGRLFSEAMAEITRFCAPHVARSLKVEPGENVLDVGGGNGEFCRLLQPFFEEARFTVLDLEEHPNSDRVTHRRGCFFQAIPSGFDHVLMKNILHDWEDEQAIAILRNCRRAAERGRLSLVELVLPESASTGPGSDFNVDWNVYCTLGGRERTLQQYKALLQKAGWTLRRVAPTATPLWVLEAD